MRKIYRKKHLTESNLRSIRRRRLLENRHKRLIEADEDITVPFTLSQADIMNPDSLDLKKIGKGLVDAEKSRRAEAERQRKNAELKAKYSNIFDIIKQDPNGAVAIEELFKELVPSEGPSEIVAGELARAANKIGYRWYNDGDILCVGYGVETCSNAINYIISIIPGVEDEVYNLADNLTGSESRDEATYEDFLNNLFQVVVDWIDEHPDEAIQPAEDMYSKQFDNEEWLYELEPKEEYDINADWNYELADYIKNFEDIIEYSLDDLLSDFADDYGMQDVFDRLGAKQTGGYRDVLFYEVPVSNAADFEREVTGWFDEKFEELQREFGDWDELESRSEEAEDFYEDEPEEESEE